MGLGRRRRYSRSMLEVVEFSSSSSSRHVSRGGVAISKISCTSFDDHDDDASYHHQSFDPFIEDVYPIFLVSEASPLEQSMHDSRRTVQANRHLVQQAALFRASTRGRIAVGDVRRRP